MRARILYDSTISLRSHHDEISFPLTKGSSLSASSAVILRAINLRRRLTEDSLKNIALNIEHTHNFMEIMKL